MIISNPNNYGCLKPITIIIPPCSILDPSDIGAVVDGNVLICHHMVNVVFKVFEACAASQGCMEVMIPFVIMKLWLVELEQ